MFSRRFTNASVAVALLLPSLVFAADNCYVAGKVPLEKHEYSASIVLLLDETVVFDATQQEHIKENIHALIKSGHELKAFTFSAFQNGRYTLPVLDARLAKTLDSKTRDNMRKDHLRDFDMCQQVAEIRTKKMIDALLEKYFARSSSALSKSDVLSTMKEIGDNVFPMTKSKSKYMVMVSDMLENSNITSFYAPDAGPRKIDAAVELAKTDKAKVFTDYRGSKVYVIGAGVVPKSNKPQPGNYRSQEIMAPLKSFWVQYFEKSNAKLVEFGQPLLLSPLGELK